MDPEHMDDVNLGFVPAWTVYSAAVSLCDKQQWHKGTAHNRPATTDGLGGGATTHLLGLYSAGLPYLLISNHPLHAFEGKHELLTLVSSWRAT